MAAQTAQAVFSGASTAAITYPAMPGNYGYAFGLTVTDGGGPVDVWITSPTNTGATVNLSSARSCTVDVLIYDKP